ncbi:hypothetical protein RIF29_28314 [Crotalaria pallida]|uniref:Uncharacterized protein n=1 Tax=Crotalaria pallida TaxID=3830 RepID=A0AAN9ER63_CROPI
MRQVNFIIKHTDESQPPLSTAGSLSPSVLPSPPILSLPDLVTSVLPLPPCLRFPLLLSLGAFVPLSLRSLSPTACRSPSGSLSLRLSQSATASARCRCRFGFSLLEHGFV